MNESAGVRNDCCLEKKAKPMMYIGTSIAKSQGTVNGRVVLIKVDSSGATMCFPAIWVSMFSKGAGAGMAYVSERGPCKGIGYARGRSTFGRGPLRYRIALTIQAWARGLVWAKVREALEGHVVGSG